MNHMLFRAARVSACCVAIFAGFAASAAGPSVPGRALDMNVPASVHDALAFRRLMTDAPGTRTLELEGWLKRVYGPALSTGASPVESADRFIARYVELFGVRAADLAPWSLSGDGTHTTPLMAGDDGAPAFTLVTYAQTFEGVPVYKADLRLLARNTEINDLVWVGNALRPLGNFVLDPDVLVAPAIRAATDAAIFKEPGLVGGTISDPEFTIFAGLNSQRAEPVLAVKFTGETAAREWEAGYGKWEFVADAATGQILHRENLVCEFNQTVSGRVSGLATTGIRAAECNPEADTGMPYALVTIGAQTTYADVNGNYTMTGVPAGTYTASSSPRGLYFDVYNPTNRVPATLAAPDSPNVQLNSANTDQLVRAGVNAYLHANVVRDMVLSASPNYPTISTQLNFRINVGVSGTCNAFYNGTSINFYNSGGGCNNTAFYDVVHHEFGHHVVATGGSGQGQYGEGMSDCMGVIISDQPILGTGFQGNCNAGIRNANNTLQYPQNESTVPIHTAGQLISGAVWSTRNELVARGTPNYQTLLQRLTVNSVPLHTGTTIAPDITVDFMTLDDTDGNINNGTPNYAAIQAGFSRHNMAGPAIQPIDFQYPDGLPPATISPGQARSFRVNVVALGGTPADNTGTLTYRVGSGSNITVPMQRLAPNQYLATIPAQSCGSIISYSVAAQATGGSSFSSPTSTTIAASSQVTRFSDNFNTNLGWAASNTAVSGGTATGNWARGAQLDTNGAAPTTDYDGSGQMVSTDPRAGTGLGSFDVDWNIVRVTSPAIDASGGAAVVSYARWFSNNLGSSPNDDRFLVEVSGDNGATWTPLEQVGPNGGPQQQGGWYPKSFTLPPSVATSQFRIRFSTSDNAVISPATTNGGSVVEAAVDAVSVTVFPCSAPCAADFDGSGFVDSDDFIAYVAAFELGCTGAGTPDAGCVKSADFDQSGFVDSDDFIAFADAFNAGCP